MNWRARQMDESRNEIPIVYVKFFFSSHLRNASDLKRITLNVEWVHKWMMRFFFVFGCLLPFGFGVKLVVSRPYVTVLMWWLANDFTFVTYDGRDSSNMASKYFEINNAEKFRIIAPLNWGKCRCIRLNAIERSKRIIHTINENMTNV